MSWKDSFIWMGLYCLIWGVHLSSSLLDPASGRAGLDFIFSLSATSLLVPLVLLLKRRARSEIKQITQLARDAESRAAVSIAESNQVLEDMGFKRSRRKTKGRQDPGGS